MKTVPTSLAVAMAAMFVSAAAWSDSADTLPTVHVTADPLAKAVRFPDLYVTAEDIRDKNATDLKSALDDVPGVSVTGVQGARQGNDSVNIRGITGNRVQMQVDGIDLPASNENKYMSGQGIVFGRGEFVDVSSLRSIRVAKGSRDSALGGAVQMRTLRPDDILKGEKYGGYVESLYDSTDKSTVLSGAAAASQGIWKGMVLGTWRKGGETDNRGNVGGTGDNRTRPDPADYNSRYILTHHDFQLNEKNALSVTGEYLQKNRWTSFLSQVTNKIDNYDTKDENERTRFSVGHHYVSADGPVQEIDTQLYWQKSQTTADRMSTGSGFTSKYYSPKGVRHQFYENTDKVWGLNSDWKSIVGGDAVDQVWRYGISAAHHDLSSRWESTYLYAKGKPVADSREIKVRLYADADFDFGSFVLSPGLSAHYYRFSPRDGNGYVQTSKVDAVAPAAGQHGYQLTPRIGLTWKLHPLFNPYFRYARGYNPPSSQQLVTSFSPGFYTLMGNPDLKPETGNNFEIGFKGSNDTVDYGISGFSNYYRNFIDFVSVDTLPGEMFTLQYKNFSKARIYGGEAYAKWNITPQWQLSGSLAYAHGRYEEEGEKRPVNSVLPFNMKMGVAYKQEKWGANVDVRYAAGKKDKDIYAKSSSWFNPSRSYALVDLGAYWKPTKHLSFNAGINNLFDKKYWNWADISYLAANTDYSQSDDTVSLKRTNADRYTAPGRNFNIAVRYTF